MKQNDECRECKLIAALTVMLSEKTKKINELKGKAMAIENLKNIEVFQLN